MVYRAKLNRSKKEFLEFRRFHKWLRYRILYSCLKVLFLLSAAALCTLLILTIVRYGSLGISTLYYLLFGLYFAWYFSRDRIAAGKAEKEEREQIGDGADVTYDEDEVCVTAKNAAEQYKYPAFTEIYHRRGCYYLYVGKKRCFFLPERCITEGNPAAFGAFISEKTGLEVKEVK